MNKISHTLISFFAKESSFVKRAFFEEDTWRSLVEPKDKDKMEDLLDTILAKEASFKPTARISALRIMSGPLAKTIAHSIHTGTPLSGRVLQGSREIMEEAAKHSEEVSDTIRKIIGEEEWTKAYPGLADKAFDVYAFSSIKSMIVHILGPVMHDLVGTPGYLPIVELGPTGDIVLTKVADSVKDLKEFYLQASGENFKEASSPLRGRPDYDGSGAHPAARAKLTDYSENLT